MYFRDVHKNKSDREGRRLVSFNFSSQISSNVFNWDLYTHGYMLCTINSCVAISEVYSSDR